MSDTVTTLTMTGADDSRWDIMNGTEGLTLAAGLSGILFPQFEQNSVDLIQGRRFTGTRWAPAEMSATIQVGDTAGSSELAHTGGKPRTGTDWLALDAAVRRAISPGGLVTFTAAAPGTSARVLETRIDSFDADLDQMPDIRGFAEHDVDLVSDGPFWRAATPSVFDFSPVNENMADYYGGPDGNGHGTPMFIGGAGDSIDNALRNGGDVEAWPTWTVTGPVRAELTVTGRSIETKLLAAGETLVIVTAPWARSVTVDGVPAWDRLTRRQFAPVPTGDNPGVTITARDMGAGAAIRAEIRENYLGAW